MHNTGTSIYIDVLFLCPKKEDYSMKLLRNIMIIFVLLLLFSYFSMTEPIGASSFNKAFLEITVSKGDTLTAIANEYALEPYTQGSFIKEVCLINHINEDLIYAGETLLIPILLKEEVASIEYD